MAIRALDKIRDDSAVDLLIPALTDSSAEVRRRAARALGKIEDPRTIQALGTALNDEDPEVRQMVIRALGDIEDAGAVDWLIPLLSDPYVEIRREAARALGHGIYFPGDANVESVDGGHLEFIDRGLLRSVVISDSRYGGSDLPGHYAGSDEDTVEHCSRDSLGIVGDVTLEALDRISARLARSDRFHRSPLGTPPGAAGPTPARMADPGAARAVDDESALH